MKGATVALVIPRTKTIDLGGGQVGTRQSLAREIALQSLEDVRTMLRTITVNDTRQQIALGNPPSLTEVDGQAAKPVTAAEKRTVVIFGATLAAAAMRLVESALAAAIAKTTTARSGGLGDITGHWQWLLITKAGVRRVSSANPPASLTITDRLVLQPRDVPYATNVNQAVDGVLMRGGNKRRGIDDPLLTRKRRVNRAGAKGKGSSVGFLEAATAALKSRTDFRQFAVYAAFSLTHKVAGERSKKQGSPMIVIRPRLRGVRRG
jgi:hypothetical protein